MNDKEKIDWNYAREIITHITLEVLERYPDKIFDDISANDLLAETMLLEDIEREIE